MNFYIGNSVGQLNANDESVELGDEIVEYLYSIKENVPFVVFFTIDPYADTIVKKNNIVDIISMCDYVLESGKLNNYDEKEEIISTIRELDELCCNALKQNKNVIVIGD